MLPFILIAVLLARLRGYKISALKKGYALLPLLAVAFAYWTLQLLVMNGCGEVVTLTGALQTCLLLSLLPPILMYKIYIPAIIGAALSVAGSLLNRFVMSANGGFMPVKASLSVMTGYYDEALMLGDGIHCKLTDASVYKPLCDIFDTGFSIMSAGDLMMHSFIVIVIFYSIAYLNGGRPADISNTGRQNHTSPE